MHVKVDGGQLKRAARAVVALNSFAKEKKEASKEEKDTFPCLLTAKGKYLYVESAVFGLYLKYRIEAEVKAEGKFSTVAAPLKNLPDNEIIELSRVVKSEGKGKTREQKAALRIKRQNSTYTLSEVAHAEEAVVAGRVYDRKRIKNHCATLPFAALKEAINSVTFAPGLPTETLRLQIRLSKSRLEISGSDTFALAKFSLRNREIRVKRPIEAVIKTGLLRLLANEAAEEEGEGSILGLLLDQDRQPVALYLGTQRMELWHPVLGVPYRDPDESIASYFKSSRIRATFSTQNKELQSALSTVTALWVGESSNSVDVSVNRGAVSIEANIAGQHSDTVLLTEGKISAKREQNFSAPIHYLMTFAKLSPATALLKVSVCGEEVVHIASQLEKSKQLEFVLSQAGHETEGESES